MILISHRGNIIGKKPQLENSPGYIDEAIAKGYDVEIDLWRVNDDWLLGHDEPQYEIDLNWISKRSIKLWVHCKNVEALSYLIINKKESRNINYFWHESDTVTLTSLGYIWAFPGKQPIESSIAVMPELENDSLQRCIGVCSDYISNY